MATEERRVSYSITPHRVLVLLSLLAFIAAFCVAEGWLTKGTWQEWIAAGLALHVAAEFV